MELTEETVRVGPWTVSLLRPPDAEALIDEHAFARDEFLPYWAELWPSGVALARHVAARALSGVRVVELGCGLGLPSIAAALGGARVLATDWSEDALALLQDNAARNGVDVETRLIRWDDPPPLEPAALVLAADLLYERRNVDQLLALLPRLVAPGGEALVADPGRVYARTFVADARVRWDVETLPDAVLPRGGMYRLRPRDR